MGGSSSRTEYVSTGISPADLNAEAARANTAEAALARARRPPPDQVQLCRESSDPNFNPILAEMMDGALLHVAIMSLAGAGKSSFFNNVARALGGKNIPAVRSVGAGTVEGGQHSTIISRMNVTEDFIENWHQLTHASSSSSCGLLVTESVGFKKDKNEMRAIGKGLLKPSEIWPRENTEPAILKRSEISLRRALAPHVTTFVIFISIHELIDGSSESDDTVKTLITEPKSFSVTDESDGTELPIEIPVLLCITKCDEYTTNPHFNNLLAQRNSENLEPIYAKAKERFGIPQDAILCLGWQDESDQTTWSFGSQDPRAMIVRHAIFKVVESAKICQRRLNSLTNAHVGGSSRPSQQQPQQQNPRPAPQQQQSQQNNNNNSNNDDRFQELILQQFSGKIELDLLLSVLNQMKNLPPNQVIERLTEMSSNTTQTTANTNNNNKNASTAPPPPRPSQNQNQRYQHHHQHQQQPGAATAGPSSSSSSEYRRDYMPPPPPPPNNNKYNTSSSRQDYHRPHYQRPNANDDDTWTFTSTSSVRSSTNTSCSKSSAQSLKEQDITLAALAEDFNRRRRAFNGTTKQFIATLNSHELNKFLLSRRFFAENVLNLILYGKWDGKDFVADDFIPKAFYQDETVMSLYNINHVSMKAFNTARDNLLL